MGNHDRNGSQDNILVRGGVRSSDHDDHSLDGLHPPASVGYIPGTEKKRQSSGKGQTTGTLDEDCGFPRIAQTSDEEILMLLES